MIVPKPTKRAVNSLIDLRRSPEYVAGVKTIINQEFEKIKNLLLSKFESHPVTVELSGGIGASNVSGTLGGYGNLFSYIGFNEKDRPLNPIRNKFKEIFITNINIKRDGSCIVFVNYPSAKDIFQVTPLPWAQGRSWAQGIEQGLSGLGMYLNIDAGRSGGGIQTKKAYKKTKFQNTSYISAMIRDFERRINALNRITL